MHVAFTSASAVTADSGRVVIGGSTCFKAWLLVAPKRGPLVGDFRGTNADHFVSEIVADAQHGTDRPIPGCTAF